VDDAISEPSRSTGVCRFRVRVPKALSPWAIMLTLLVAGLGIAAFEIRHRAEWYGACTQDGSGRDGTDCFAGPFLTHDHFAGSIGYDRLTTAMEVAAVWVIAYLVLALVQRRRTREM
jgi:hypothetical protein